MAHLDRTIYKLFNQIAKMDLFIIDDFGLMHVEKQQQMNLMEFFEDRHGTATIIASQLPVANLV